MTSLFFALILVVLTELSCVAARRYTVSSTRVSTIPSTDHSSPLISRALIFAQGGVAALTLVFFASLGFGAWSLITTLLIYLTVRAVTAFDDLIYAGKTIKLRMLEALISPEVASSRFAFFFSGPHMLDPYHVTMWLEPMKSLNIPFLIVVQERKHLSKIPASEHYQVVCLQNLPTHFLALPRKVKTVFFANNGKRNLQMMKRHPSCNFIQLLHGDSDKPPSFHPTAKSYDYVFVAGRMGIDRYSANNVKIPPEKFRIIGRPQLTFENEVGKTKKTVVYMTTWAGDFNDMNFSSFSQAPEMIRAVIKTQNIGEIIFKPHPVSYKDPNWRDVQRAFGIIKAETDIDVRWADRTESPFELYSKADLLISDISSTIIDFLYSGKPYIVTNPQGLLGNELAKYPSVSGGYLCDRDLANVGNIVALAFGEDPITEKREEVRQYAFGDLDLPPGEAFRKVCWDIIGKPDEQATKNSP